MTRLNLFTFLNHTAQLGIFFRPVRPALTLPIQGSLNLIRTLTLNNVLRNTMKTGFQVGIGVGRYISRKMFLNLEFKFTENQVWLYR